MGLLDRFRQAVERLPLGEAPRHRAGLRHPDDALALLATSLRPDETIVWAGWVYADRGAAPDEALAEAAGAVTDQRVLWVPLRDDGEPDEEPLDDLIGPLVDRRTGRVLLCTAERDENDPGLAVLWSFDTALLIDALRSGLAEREGHRRDR